jgi:hypothetical protein
MLPDGNPYWKPDVARANAVADHVFTMYSNLSQRASSMKKAMKREAAKTMAVAEKPKSKLIVYSIVNFDKFIICVYFSGETKISGRKSEYVWFCTVCEEKYVL